MLLFVCVCVCLCFRDHLRTRCWSRSLRQVQSFPVCLVNADEGDYVMETPTLFGFITLSGKQSRTNQILCCVLAWTVWVCVSCPAEKWAKSCAPVSSWSKGISPWLNPPGGFQPFAKSLLLFSSFFSFSSKPFSFHPRPSPPTLVFGGGLSNSRFPSLVSSPGHSLCSAASVWQWGVRGGGTPRTLWLLWWVAAG